MRAFACCASHLLIIREGRNHRRWRFWYNDYQGKRRYGTGTESKTDTLRLAQRVENEHREIKLGLRPPPKPAHQTASFAAIRQEYLDWGESHGGRRGHPWSDKHRASRKRHLSWWGEQLRLEKVSDLDGCLAPVEKALRALERAGKSKKTLANYAESLCAFCDWCVERDYLNDDPLKRLRGFDTTPLERRRALSAEEIRRLMAVALRSAVCSMPLPARRGSG